MEESEKAVALADGLPYDNYLIFWIPYSRFLFYIKAKNPGVRIQNPTAVDDDERGMTA